MEVSMGFRRIICMSAIATCVAFSALAQGLPKANKPEDVGFSSDRLKRVTDAFQSEVDKGAIPGAVVLIARNGKIAYFEAFGFQNRENKEPMKTDAIFRIASMSKPITSVAVMMLVEEGKIQLLDPVSRYLPEFKGVQVGLEKLNTTTGNSELIGEPPRQERYKTYCDILPASPMAFSVSRSSNRPTTKQISLIAIRRSRNLFQRLRSSRSPTTRERPGNTVILPMCSAVLLRSFRE
jgi:hypothetical protein